MKHLNSWWWKTSTSALPYLVIKGHKVWSVSPEYFIFSTFFSDPVRSLSCLDSCTVLQTKLTFAQDLYQLLYNKVLDDGFNSVQWCNKNLTDHKRFLQFPNYLRLTITCVAFRKCQHTSGENWPFCFACKKYGRSVFLVHKSGFPDF